MYMWPTAQRKVTTAKFEKSKEEEGRSPTGFPIEWLAMIEEKGDELAISSLAYSQAPLDQDKTWLIALRYYSQG